MEEVYERYFSSVGAYAAARGIPAPGTPPRHAALSRGDTGSPTGGQGGRLLSPVKGGRLRYPWTKKTLGRGRSVPTTKYVGAYTKLYSSFGMYNAARRTVHGLACVVKPTQKEGCTALLSRVRLPQPSKKAAVFA